jgi:hypothetical protein
MKSSKGSGRWEDTIKMYLNEIECYDDWIHLSGQVSMVGSHEHGNEVFLYVRGITFLAS